MKKQLQSAFILFVCLLSLQARAQKYELMIGESVKDKVRPASFIGTDNDGSIYMAGNKLKYNMVIPLLLVNHYSASLQRYIKKYDSKLALVEDKKVMAGDANAGGKAQINASINYFSVLFFGSLNISNLDLPDFMLDGKYYMIGRGGKNAANKYYLLDIDMNSGFMNNCSQALVLSKSNDNLNVTNFEVQFSPDSNYLLLLATYTKDKSSKSNIAFAASVLSRDMKPVWSASYSLPKVSETFTYKDAKVGNKGEILIVGRNYNKKNKDNPGYLSVFSLDKDNPKPKETRLNFAGDFVDDVYLTMSAGNDPLIMGFYKSQRKKKGYDGIYYASLNENREIFNARKKEFTQDLITMTYTKKEAKRSDRKARRKDDSYEDKDFTFTDFMRDGNGGYVAVAEEYYMVERTETTVSARTITTRTTYIHHYNDLLVVRFDNDANITSMNKVAKSNSYMSGSRGNGLYIEQHKGWGGIAGKPFNKDYAMFTMGDNVFLMFNDNAGTEENVHSRKADRYFNRATYIASIDASGAVNKEEVIGRKKMGRYTFDPRGGVFKANGNKVAFLAIKGSGLSRKTLLGSVTIN